MPLEAPLAPIGERVTGLNARYRHHSAISVVHRALTDPQVGRITMVSSFGAESVALLHMICVVDRTTPVLFLDTKVLFAETLAYQADLGAKLGLTDVRVLHPDRAQLCARDPDDALHLADPDGCCRLRKIEPLRRALDPFDAWTTGRKRYQGGERATPEFFETEDDRRIKVNPLAHWDRTDVQDYIANNRLPRHPLAGKGYPSLGCGPCTSQAAPGENQRAGRWSGRGKAEGGIHFVDGNVVRVPVAPD
ncbi:MAG: phosphoadenylyl-sulfate reductase [Rhodobacteraceae bacterium]|nr:phosphoadenylyl-sulfate reductase [Paracoccaceae bacterium]